MDKQQLISFLDNKSLSQNYTYINNDVRNSYNSSLNGKIMIFTSHFNDFNNFKSFIKSGLFDIVKRRNLDCKFNKAVVVLYVDIMDYKLIISLMKEIVLIVDKPNIPLYYKLDIQTVVDKILDKNSVFSSKYYGEINLNTIKNIVSTLSKKFEKIDLGFYSEDFVRFIKQQEMSVSSLNRKLNN